MSRRKLGWDERKFELQPPKGWPKKWPKIVKVEWLDASRNDTFYQRGEAVAQGIRLEDVGYLLNKDREFVTLTNEIRLEDGWGVRMTKCIPVGMILSMKELK